MFNSGITHALQLNRIYIYGCLNTHNTHELLSMSLKEARKRTNCLQLISFTQKQRVILVGGREKKIYQNNQQLNAHTNCYMFLYLFFTFNVNPST